MLGGADDGEDAAKAILVPSNTCIVFLLMEVDACRDLERLLLGRSRKLPFFIIFLILLLEN